MSASTAWHHTGLYRGQQPQGQCRHRTLYRTLKEELVWVNEWRSPTAFTAALDDWINYYNTRYLHSTLGYRSPVAVEQERLNPQLPLKEAC